MKVQNQQVKTAIGFVMTNNFVSFDRTLVTQIIDNEVLLLVSDKNPIQVRMVLVSNLTNYDIMISLTQTGLLENPISTFKMQYQLKGNQTANILQGSYLLLTDTDHLKIKTSSYEQKASVAVIYRTYNEDTADMQNNLNKIHASLKSLTQSHSDLQSRVATISASHEELNSLVQNDLINYINEQYTNIYDTFNQYANQLVDEVKQDLTTFKKEINDKYDSINNVIKPEEIKPQEEVINNGE